MTYILLTGSCFGLDTDTGKRKVAYHFLVRREKKSFDFKLQIIFKPISLFFSLIHRKLQCQNTITTDAVCLFKPFPKQQISESSKLKEFADDNFNLDENC